LLDKTLAKKTNNILFVKIDNDGFDLGAQRRAIDKNDLTACLPLLQQYKQALQSGKPFLSDNKNVFLVDKETIAAKDDYNLSIDRYRVNENVKQSKFEMVRLGDVCDIGAGNSAPQGENYFKNGVVPFFRTSDVGEIHISSNLLNTRDKVTAEAIKVYGLKLFPKGTILFPKSGASVFLNHRVMIGFDGYVSSHLATINANQNRLVQSFLFYLLCQIDAKKLTEDQNYPSLRLSDISNIEIPLPPLSVQQQIVAKIENYQAIINGAKLVIENYKPQIDINSDWEMVELGEVLKLSSGKGLTQQNMKQGNYPVYGGNGINGYHNEYFIEEPIIVIGRVGAYCGAVQITEAKSWITDNGLFVTEYLTTINQKYLAQMLVQLNLNQFAKVGGQPSISQNTIYELKIPLPPLSEQQQIVRRIEEEQALVNGNKKLIALYEQKIKDEINKLWEKEPVEYVTEEGFSVAAEGVNKKLSEKPGC